MSKKHGAPKRKDGPRHANGRLKFEPSIDQGHDATLERRACLVGTANARDPKAGYPLGVLLMNGQLADPLPENPTKEAASAAEAQALKRHDAGLHYAVDHAILFGVGTPKSHLANLISASRSKAPDTGDGKFLLDTGERYGRKVAAVRLLPPPSNPFPFHILERIAIDEAFDLTPPELDALKRALDALVAFRP